jgi:alanine racemase
LRFNTVPAPAATVRRAGGLLDDRSAHPTRARIHLDRLRRNFALLRELAGGRPLWPAVKGDAYGHGAVPVARELEAAGCDTLCVAHPCEARELRAAGVAARLVLLAPLVPDAVEEALGPGFEPVVGSLELLDALAGAAERTQRAVAIHLKVDTGMGRAGFRPDALSAALARCAARPSLRVRGVMSHFPRADEGDPTFSRAQIATFAQLRAAAGAPPGTLFHLANSAALFELPESVFDAARPGVALYGLAPSTRVASPRVAELAPVLEWTTRVAFLKEVPAGTGLSYGHAARTTRPSLVATLPVGYADGLRRGLSGRIDVLLHGVRCAQLGTITMDQCLVDATPLRGRIALGDEAVLIGRQGDAEIGAGELAERLGTIAYEIVTGIAQRVPRVPSGGTAGEPRTVPG